MYVSSWGALYLGVLVYEFIDLPRSNGPLRSLTMANHYRFRATGKRWTSKVQPPPPTFTRHYFLGWWLRKPTCWQCKSTCASQRCLAGKPTAHSTCSSIITSARRKGMTMTLRNSLGNRVKESEPHHLQFSKGLVNAKASQYPQTWCSCAARKSSELGHLWSLYVT